MRQTDRLFRQTIVRVGHDNMRGVIRLMDDGYHGLAEKQTVAKLIGYIKVLEEKMGIQIPDPDKTSRTDGMIKITEKAVTYYTPSATGA